jgi:DNA/RNA endonuclease YhcR with UshA esterase domain
MLRTRTLIGLLSLLLALSPFVRAEEKDDKKDAKDDKAPSAAVIQAGDTDALKAAMGKDAVVEGTVARIGASKSGSITFINFEEASESNFTAIVEKAHKDEVDKGFDGDLTKALQGAKIRVKGKMIEYKGKPEIKVEKAAQVTVVEKAKGADAPAAEPAHPQ